MPAIVVLFAGMARSYKDVGTITDNPRILHLEDETRKIVGLRYANPTYQTGADEENEIRDCRQVLRLPIPTAHAETHPLKRLPDGECPPVFQLLIPCGWAQHSRLSLFAR